MMMLMDPSSSSASNTRPYPTDVCRLQGVVVSPRTNGKRVRFYNNPINGTSVTQEIPIEKYSADDRQLLFWSRDCKRSFFEQAVADCAEDVVASIDSVYRDCTLAMVMAKQQRDITTTVRKQKQPTHPSTLFDSPVDLHHCMLAWSQSPGRGLEPLLLAGSRRRQHVRTLLRFQRKLQARLPSSSNNNNIDTALSLRKCSCRTSQPSVLFAFVIALGDTAAAERCNG